jgi:hypothetical protein
LWDGTLPHEPYKVANPLSESFETTSLFHYMSHQNMALCSSEMAAIPLISLESRFRPIGERSCCQSFLAEDAV